MKPFIHHSPVEIHFGQALLHATMAALGRLVQRPGDAEASGDLLWAAAMVWGGSRRSGEATRIGNAAGSRKASAGTSIPTTVPAWLYSPRYGWSSSAVTRPSPSPGSLATSWGLPRATTGGRRAKGSSAIDAGSPWSGLQGVYGLRQWGRVPGRRAAGRSPHRAADLRLPGLAAADEEP
jgi:hypothetical protein